MNNNNLGTISIGLRMPIIKSGDDVKKIICDEIDRLIINGTITIQNDDVLCVTESLIARAYNNYVSIDDIADFIKTKYGDDTTIGVLWPIYSRNRFSMILSGISRGASRVVVQLYHNKDEVGNDIENPWTGVNIVDYYRQLIIKEGAEPVILQSNNIYDIMSYTRGCVVVSSIHSRNEYRKQLYDFVSWNEDKYSYDNIITLEDIFSTKSTVHGWSEYGLLGSNKCGDERLKLFPTKESCKDVCEYIKEHVLVTTNSSIHVMVYGDGCFKDPVGGIWEFADPISCPYHTGDLLNKSPEEIKIKYIADTLTNDDNIRNWIRDKHNMINDNQMLNQGTTPRRYFDLLASLADLTSGSGDKGTPVVLIQNYFKNYAD